MKKHVLLAKMLMFLAFTGALSWDSLTSVHAQVSTYLFNQQNGTYTPITGTPFLVNTDDGNSAVQSIGFTFNFAGNDFTEFIVNSNGHIRLGSTSPSTSQYNPISDGANTNALSPFGRDGRTQGGVIVQTIGSAPNRVCVVQFDAYQVHWSATAETIDMQIRMYETTNSIEFIYANPAPSGTNRFSQVGIKGASGDFNNRTTTTNWNASTAGGVATNTMSFSTSVIMPVNGLTFSWTPPFPCSGTPNPGNTLSSVASACTGADFTLSLQNVTLGLGVSYQWQTSPDGSSWTNAGPDAATWTTNQTEATFYRCLVTCTESSESTASNSIEVEMESFLNCYCTTDVGPTTLADSEILGVTLNGAASSINNPTPCPAVTGVQDFTSQSVNLAQGVSYDLNVLMGSCGGSFNNVLKAWIDYNQDGVWDPATEQLSTFVSQQANSTGVNGTLTFTVPEGAPLGTTRLRVMMSETANEGLVLPCASYSWGSVHDYTIEIVENLLCTGTPDNGVAAISIASGCAGVNFNLSTSGLSFGEGIEYQWQESATGSAPWTDIVGATSPALSTSATQETFYRLRTTCTNSAEETFTNVVSYGVVDCFNVPFSGSNSITTCSGFLYDHAGPGANYNNNANGFTVINPTAGNLAQVQGFTAGEEDCCDFLRIYDGDGITGTLLWEGFAGAGAVPLTTSISGALTVRFTSDFSVNGPGFELEISCTPAPSCFDPLGLSTTNILSTSANHSWNAPAEIPAAGYEWAVTESATPPANGTFTTETSAASMGLVASTQYFLHVRSDCGSGDFSGWVTSSFTTLSPGDLCSLAIPISCGANETGTTVGRPNTPLSTCGTTTGNAGMAWYQFTGTGGQMTASTLSSEFDTKVWVYSGACGELTCVGGNDDFGGTLQAQVSFNTVAGVNYYVIVGGFGANQGNYVLNLFCTTQLQAGSCGATDVAPNQLLFASNVGAPQYRFRITGANTGGAGWNGNTFILNRPHRYFYFSHLVPSVIAGETYSVEVASGDGNGNFGPYGAACDVTLTNTIPTTQIQTSQCGATVNGNNLIFANQIFDAQGYRFKITGPNNGGAGWDNDEFILDRPNRNFYFSWLVPGATPGGTFSVEVAYLLNDGVTYSSYGAACDITLNPQTTQIQASQCGATGVMPNALVFANQVFDAQGYRFRITGNNDGSTGWNDDVFILDRPNRNFNFQWGVPGSLAGETYEVEVAFLQNDGVTYSAYGIMCEITLFGTSELAINDDNEIFQDNKSMISVEFGANASHNPFTTDFGLQVLNANDTETINVNVYDMSGKLIERNAVNAMDIETARFGANLAAGMYMIEVRQGSNQAVIRQVKN